MDNYNTKIDSIYRLLSIEDKINCIVASAEMSDRPNKLKIQQYVCDHAIASDSCKSISFWANMDYILQDSSVNITSASPQLVRSALMREKNNKLQSLFAEWLSTSDCKGFYYDIKSPYAMLFPETDLSLMDYFYVPYGRFLSPYPNNTESSYYSLDVYEYPSKVLSSHKMNRLEQEFNNRHYDAVNTPLLEGMKWLDYERLMEEKKEPSVETVLLQGGVFYAADKSKVVQELKRLFSTDVLDERMLERSCKNSLLQQSFRRNKSFIKTKLSKEQILDNISIRMHRQGLVLLKNDAIIPINKLASRSIAVVNIGEQKLTSFNEMLQHYKAVELFNLKVPSESRINKLLKELKDVNTLIVTVDEEWLDKNKFKQLNSIIEALSENKDLIISYFGSGETLYKLDDSLDYKALSLAFDADPLSQLTMAQLLMGGVGAQGVLPYSIKDHFEFGTGKETAKSRLGYASDYYNSLPDSLSNIDKIVYKAIRERATPGCQVLVAQGGDIIYNKSFGYHTYDKKKHVTNTNLYDIASITKVTASIPSLMAMVEEEKLNLDDSLSMHLPRMIGSNKSGMRIGDMLVHQAGLQAWIPFYMRTIDMDKVKGKLYSSRYSANYNIRVDKRLYMNKTVRFSTDVFKTSKNEKFNIRVCDRLFMNSQYLDSIQMAIDTSVVRSPAKYRYSDLAYYYYKDIIELAYNEPLQDLVQEKLYQPLGADRLTYLPLQKFPKKEIIPSENDLQWRKEVVQGYVHDPGAAMLGGVGGHAGLFSNAESLAKVYQMYLQKGSYGGEQFFKPETVDLFTSTTKEGNRRGLGFDKPETDPEKASPSCEETSPSSYGHSGFTGTLVWVDPEYDLIYIFLSNRVFPRQYNKTLIKTNVRTDIHSAIYHSLPEFWEKQQEIKN